MVLLIWLLSYDDGAVHFYALMNHDQGPFLRLIEFNQQSALILLFMIY